MLFISIYRVKFLVKMIRCDDKQKFSGIWLYLSKGQVRKNKQRKRTDTACIVSITAKSGLYKERKRCKIVKKGE